MTNKRKNIIFAAAVLAVAAVLWLVCRTGGSGHTAVLRYGTPQTEQRIDLRRDAGLQRQRKWLTFAPPACLQTV
mgnify:CR=1 FL=1